MGLSGSLSLREARLDDHAAIKEITAETWTDRDRGDYLGRVYPEWLDSGELPKATFVVDDGGTAVGIAQAVMLSDHEGWSQGLRVHPDYRGEGIARALTHQLFRWCSEQGATVVRAMVFAWNAPGLGQARANGFRADTMFRWTHPTPSSEQAAAKRLERHGGIELPAPRSFRVSEDPRVAWSAFRASRGARALNGLALSPDESWSVRELTPELLEQAAKQTAVLAIRSETGSEAMSLRTRTYDRETDDGDTDHIAEYGVAVWSDLTSAAALFDAIAADAASVGADRTYVLIPETPQFVTDAAVLRGDLSEFADYIVRADMTGTSPF